MKLPYNKNDLQSILAYAKKLKNKSLKDVTDNDLLIAFKGKGGFGQTLEKFYFFYNPNSDAKPDFPEIGLELKASPLKLLLNGEYRSKERLVLNIINYLEVINEDFLNSSFWKKNAHLLLIFYLYEKEKPFIDFVIKLVSDWKYPEKDLQIIKQDWEKINQKIKEGKAHELSEGDTLYLGACTKGSKGGNIRPQPNNDLPAKQRAYSLKSSYVNHIIASISEKEKDTFGKFIKSKKVLVSKTFEEIVLEKFNSLLGKSISELLKKFNLHNILPTSKNYHSRVAKAITKMILDVPIDKKIGEYYEEFSKSDISIKTVRIKQNNLPAEDISLPTFKYEEIYNGSWRASDLKYDVERKYLFVFFKYQNDNNLILEKVRFWNMSNDDIYLAKLIWIMLKKLIIEGKIVKEVVENRNGNEIRKTYFPSIKTKNIHIRPHAIDRNDTFPLPFVDKVTNQKEYTKHSFWFNKGYVRDEIYLK